MMNNECTRVGLPEPKISDNGSFVKVIFTRPTSKEGHKLNINRTQANVSLESININIVKIIRAIGENWFSMYELLGIMGFKSRSTFSKKYLTPSIESGFVQYEDTSNPTSPNQRYGLTVKGKAIYYSNK